MKEFSKRFLTLLAFSFRKFPSALACKILSCSGAIENEGITHALQNTFSSYDLRRLESYGKNLVDYHLITDIVPTMAKVYYTAGVDNGELSLSPTQATLLLGMGLQYKQLDAIGG